MAPEAEQTTEPTNDSEDIKALLQQAFDDDAGDDAETATTETDGEDAGAATSEGDNVVEGDENEPKVGNKETKAGAETGDAEEKAASAAKEPDPDAEKDEGAEAETDENREALEPLPNWSRARKEAFKELPVEHQKAVLDWNAPFQADITRREQEIAELRKTAETFNEAVAPFSAYMASLRIEPAQAVKILLGTEYALRTAAPDQRVKIFADLARQYGIDPVDLATIEPEDAQTVDPELASLRQEVGQIRTRLDETSEQARAASTAETEQIIKEFAEATGPDGKLLHPYFEDVSVLVGNLMADERLDMETAYQQAVWAKPEVRERLMAEERRKTAEAEAQERAKAEAKAKQERTAKAKAAKRAAPSVTSGSEPGQNGGPPADTLRGELERVYEELS